ncbi:MAG: NADH-quinone oxidoreductase subunit L [Bacteroidota bacterium]|nr:NADH-quinone oxidoreductase subunit L [Bacteroidota bacterium]
MHEYIGFVVLFPFLGFLINGLLGSKLKSEKIIGSIGSGVIGIGFAIAAVIFFQMLSSPVENRSHIIEIFNWINVGSISINAAYQVDQLSIIMTLVVTGIGFLIHVYAIGYMHGDKGYWRFFAYLNLFIFMMLNLVLADNFLLMFLGWEGVGLCSYLLIGFWYDKKFEKGTTNDAAMKAFVVNRVGDFGFLIAMFLIFITFGSLNFGTVFGRAAAFSVGDVTIFWIALLLFLGATGKSAQIPLYVWLPDAMAGPTPVSALIHAATMVTAGVYMVARASIFFALSPTMMLIVAIIGALTAILAASIGLVQNGIKKVLAYSTISQLGYMFLALGVGAFATGLFHVVTHAFFKALLFLGAGSVIHAMHDEEDIQKMGGLKSKMPTTYKTFVIAALAISGIPPLSGFFSKDEILWKVFDAGYWPLWILAASGAALTAFYMFRLTILTFEGAPRWDKDKHPHEAPKVMTIPLIILAVLSVIGGFIGIPAALGGSNAIEHFLDPIFERSNSILAFGHHEVVPTEYILMLLSVVIAAAGILFARHIYLKRKDIAEKLSEKYSGIHNLLWNKYFVDEIYDATILAPTVKASDKLLWKIFDVGIIDGAVNGTAKLINILSGYTRRTQAGFTQSYAAYFVAGIIIILAILIIR